ncbi:hypothetical protein HRR83_004644 [Exophiala dermatitidis]|nr:hypothetical protein HRR74_004075 [Exophiala dermatitidis]KAJ4529150.1 hypothetical protein HRR73_000170 [Exophiala dermatitidis]KAJ4582527.1 hypothetical protein HRR81_001253 [Exophiala dermatitidis]KAJ4597213.1 hypothetical protein HRR83_004644 [Exophiala dermatitidis]KAJ4616685.1 hypothetical protein HRR86_007573 [Exophiala dermatitidis]
MNPPTRGDSGAIKTAPRAFKGHLALRRRHRNASIPTGPGLQLASYQLVPHRVSSPPYTVFRSRSLRSPAYRMAAFSVTHGQNVEFPTSPVGGQANIAGSIKFSSISVEVSFIIKTHGVHTYTSWTI